MFAWTWYLWNLFWEVPLEFFFGPAWLLFLWLATPISTIYGIVNWLQLPINIFLWANTIFFTFNYFNLFTIPTTVTVVLGAIGGVIGYFVSIATSTTTTSTTKS